jgi:hypothetical protein
MKNLVEWNSMVTEDAPFNCLVGYTRSRKVEPQAPECREENDQRGHHGVDQRNVDRVPKDELEVVNPTIQYKRVDTKE